MKDPPCPFGAACKGLNGSPFLTGRDCPGCEVLRQQRVTRLVPPTISPRGVVPESVKARLKITAAIRARPSLRPPCRSLGLATGESQVCETCAGVVNLKLFGCAVHGVCTPGKALPGVANCHTCPDYVEKV